ncbi:MAG: hypothetical protein R3B70_12820 [Polyangiaceae bacterium]
MNRILVSQLLALALTALLAGCDDGGGGTGGEAGTAGTAGTGGATGGTGGAATTGGTGGSASLKFFTTCGDPACMGASDDPNIENCTTQKEGDPCTTDGITCELEADDCNVSLVCAATDPKDQQGGCPISLASAKQDIAYLTPAEGDRIRGDLVSMPLATWKYKREGAAEKEHLGFIIDDQPRSSPAVRPSGERVDLYGYTSMAVAAIQSQEREMEALRREVTALRDELRRAREPACSCSSPSH